MSVAPSLPYNGSQWQCALSNPLVSSQLLCGELGNYLIAAGVWDCSVQVHLLGSAPGSSSGAGGSVVPLSSVVPTRVVQVWRAAPRTAVFF